MPHASASPCPSSPFSVVSIAFKLLHPTHPLPPARAPRGLYQEVLCLPPWHASTSRMGLAGSGSPNSWLLVAPMVIQHQAFFPCSLGAMQKLPCHPWGGITPALSVLCCACCFSGARALHVAWLCCTCVAPAGHTGWSLLLRMRPGELLPAQSFIPTQVSQSCISASFPAHIPCVDASPPAKMPDPGLPRSG